MNYTGGSTLAENYNNLKRRYEYRESALRLAQLEGRGRALQLTILSKFIQDNDLKPVFDLWYAESQVRGDLPTMEDVI